MLTIGDPSSLFGLLQSSASCTLSLALRSIVIRGGSMTGGGTYGGGLFRLSAYPRPRRVAGLRRKPRHCWSSASVAALAMASWRIFSVATIAR